MPGIILRRSDLSDKIPRFFTKLNDPDTCMMRELELKFGITKIRFVSASDPKLKQTHHSYF